MSPFREVPDSERSEADFTHHVRENGFFHLALDCPLMAKNLTEEPFGHIVERAVNRAFMALGELGNPIFAPHHLVPQFSS